MLTAKQARDISYPNTAKKVAQELAGIELQIDTAARAGKTYIELNDPHQETITELRDLGYNATLTHIPESKWRLSW